MSFIFTFLRELVNIFLDAGIYVLIGFVFAGLINLLLPTALLMRYLGGGKLRSIYMAALVGAPFPLCSCAVIPTAVTLRKRGAGRGASAAFLISTPETDIDSLFLTYGLMDTTMTIVRPFAAVIAATMTGMIVEWGSSDADLPPDEAEEIASCCSTETPEPPKVEASCCSTEEPTVPVKPPADHGESCCSTAPPPPPAAEHDDCCSHDAEPELDVSQPERTLPERLRYWWDNSLGFSFGTLMEETAYWLLVGLTGSASVAAIVPPDFVENYLGAGLVPKLVMLLVGIPIYVCSASSTPLAATFVSMGMSPGTALVFLLAGPATNIGLITVLLKYFGKKFVALYVFSIAVTSMLLGYALDWIYTGFNIPVQMRMQGEMAMFPKWVLVTGAIILFGFIMHGVYKRPLPKELSFFSSGWRLVTGTEASKAKTAGTALLLLLAIWSTTAVTAVRPDEVGFRSSFGVVSDSALQPGLYLHLPTPFGEIETLNPDAVRRVEIGFRSGHGKADDHDVFADLPATNKLPNDANRLSKESFLVTGDENLIDATVTLHYTVNDPFTFRYRWTPETLEKTLRNVALSALVEELAGRPIDAVYTNERNAIETGALSSAKQAAQAMNTGVEIVGVRLIDVHAPAEVHPRFRDVASAMEDKQRYVNEAHAYYEEITRWASGEATRVKSEAESARLSSVVEAGGEAASYVAKRDAFAVAPELFQINAYLDTVESNLADRRLIIKPTDASSSAQFDIWLTPENGDSNRPLQNRRTGGLPGLGGVDPRERVRNVMGELVNPASGHGMGGPE